MYNSENVSIFLQANKSITRVLDRLIIYRCTLIFRVLLWGFASVACLADRQNRLYSFVARPAATQAMLRKQLSFLFFRYMLRYFILCWILQLKIK